MKEKSECASINCVACECSREQYSNNAARLHARWRSDCARFASSGRGYSICGCSELCMAWSSCFPDGMMSLSATIELIVKPSHTHISVTACNVVRIGLMGLVAMSNVHQVTSACCSLHRYKACLPTQASTRLVHGSTQLRTIGMVWITKEHEHIRQESTSVSTRHLH
jgi:hypothetical protein